MRSRQGDIAFGLHSGIPRCCIDFYVNEWEEEFENRSAYWHLVQLSDYNYVPCVACFNNEQMVRMRICESECGRKCWKDEAYK